MFGGWYGVDGKCRNSMIKTKKMVFAKKIVKLRAGMRDDNDQATGRKVTVLKAKTSSRSARGTDVR